MKSFDANKLLPQNIIIKWVDTHPYRIGLSFDSLNHGIRGIFDNPILIFMTTLIILIKVIILWLKPEAGQERRQEGPNGKDAQQVSGEKQTQVKKNDSNPCYLQ